MSYFKMHLEKSPLALGIGLQLTLAWQEGSSFCAMQKACTAATTDCFIWQPVNTPAILVVISQFVSDTQSGRSCRDRQAALISDRLVSGIGGGLSVVVGAVIFGKSSFAMFTSWGLMV